MAILTPARSFGVRVRPNLRGPALILAATLVASCSLTRDDEPLGLDMGGVSVHSLLVAGSDTVLVYITRVEPQSFRIGVPLGGADVRIVNGGDTLRLSEAPEGFPRCYHDIAAHYTPAAEQYPAGPGCYAATLEGGIRSGRRYELVITLPEGRVVHGAAVVPETPALLAPAMWSHFREDQAVAGSPDDMPIEIPVHWHAPGAGAIGVTVGATSVFRAGARVPDGRCSVAEAWPALPIIRLEGDSLRYKVESVSCLEPGDSADLVALEWDSVHARVHVTAYDTAYARYAQFLPGGGSVSPEEASAGLTGALGVFAGAAAAERPVTILPAPEQQPGTGN